MTSFPNLDEMTRVQERVADFLAREPGVRDPNLLRAVLLGVRMSHRGEEAHGDHFTRAAALLEQIVTLRPFVSANGPTALAAALLYLDRHGHRIQLADGQPSALVDGARDGGLRTKQIASVLRLAVKPKREPTGPVTTSA